jgi:lysophospholipase L1-like esterase
MSKRFRLLLITLAMAAAASNLAAQGQHWVATWGTAQLTFRSPAPPPAPPAAPTPAGATSAATPPAAPLGPDPRRRHPIPPPIPGLNNQTVRMIVRASLGGEIVRVRLAHAFGAPSVAIGAAHIAIRDKESAIVAGSDRALTFGGRPTATLHGGQVLVSDPVTLAIKPLADLAVSLYLPSETGPPTSHVFGLRPTYISKPGNVAGDASIAEPDRITESWYWLAGIDVLAPAPARARGATTMTSGTLVTFGDSITDGDQSTPDRIAMWPALLAARLQANAATRHVGVVNAGISGNRLIGDNTSGLARLTLHALSVPGVKWMTLLEGINDITAATRPQPPGTPPPAPLSADDLIAAYKQVIATAHTHGVKVIGCTLTPYAESRAYSEAGEAIRQAVNTWIRTSNAFDAVVDFDAATRDPKQPNRLKPEADSPDSLHPGDPGYKMMADAIPLTLFR